MITTGAGSTVRLLRHVCGAALLAVGIGPATDALSRGSGVVHASQQAGNRQAGTVAMAGVSVARLRAYHDRLETVVRTLPPRATLADVMRPVLTFAGSDPRQADIDAENRTALVVIAFYINGWPLGAIAPEARGWSPVPRHAVVLRDRGDLAQHFIVSALLSAVAGAPIADLIGVYKELHDASGSEGFSFCDLAADRAGTMFGQMATQSPESARRLLDRMDAGLDERDMMPDIAGLPDDVPQAQFLRQFGGVGAPPYNDLVADINRRVSALRLFQ
jgi:hypothetical protein